MDAPKSKPKPETAADDSAPFSLPPTSLKIDGKEVKSKIENRVKWACIWSLVALGLIVWALLHPKPLPVIVAMSVGQLVGTISLLLFLGSVALDVRNRYKLTKRSKQTPTPPPSKSE